MPAVIASMTSLITNDCSTVMACLSYPPPSQMDGHALDVFGRLHDAFGHGGMGMDRFGERFCRRAHLHRHCGFVHDVRSMRADEMYADDFAALGFGDDLHQSRGFAGRMSFAQTGRTEFSDLDFHSLLPRLLLGETYTTDFRKRKDARRHDIVPHLGRLPEDIAHGDFALRRGNMRQHRLAHNIA